MKKCISKIMSLMLFVVMMLGNVFPSVNFVASAKSDGLKLIDFSNKSTAGLTISSGNKNNVSYSTEQARPNKPGSLKMTVPKADADVATKMFSFSSNGYITDWSDVDLIRFNIYSKEANNEQINIIFSKSSATINEGYYFYKIYANWTGWKQFEIAPTAFSIGRTINSWESIDGMYFNLGGWDGVSKVSTVLYISDIEAVYYYDIAGSAFPGSSVIYAGEKRAIKNNNEVTLSDSAEYINQKLYAPMSMYSELLGLDSTSDSVSSGDLKIAFSDSKDVAKAGAYDYKLSSPAYMIGNQMYASLEDVCEFFKIPVYIDGRYAVVGSKDDIENLNSFEKYGLNVLSEQSIYEIISPSASGDASADECEKIINNWLKPMIGNKTINSTSDSNVASRIKSLNSTAKTTREKLIKDSSSKELFEGIVSDASEDMTVAAQMIYRMAAGYGAYGGEFYGNESLRDDILYALEWFYENRYGDDEAANNKDAWRDRTQFNWHDWRIGTPTHLIPTLMIMRDDLTQEQIEKYLECFEAVAPTTSSTGANFINVCRLIIGAAALKGDYDRVKKYVKSAEVNFAYVDDGRNPENHLDAARSVYTPIRGQGFYKDGSYVFHTLHSMNGTYGLGNLSTGADFLSLFEGTAFEMSKYCTDLVADWIVNSFDSVIYKNKMPRMFLGRGDNPNEISQVRTVVTAALKCFDMFDDADRERIGSIIKEFANHSLSSFISSVAISEVAKLKEIASDSGYNSYNYSNSNILAIVDKAMHKRSDWAIGVSMSSSRVFNYECINFENPTGWYLGDGRTEIYLEDEGVGSASSYWKNIDYYRLPGTTVDTQPRKEVSIAQGNEYLSSKDFVGGVELDEEYITAAMHLESYHNESDFGKEGGSYGGPAPAHQSDLTAKKSWFAFDDEVFCLGAEVNAKANNDADVLTVVDNRYINAVGYSVLDVEEDGRDVESARFSLAEHGVDTNWSKAKKIVIPIYSEVANNDYLNFQFCVDVASISNGYVHKQIPINWKGWKNIEITIDSNAKWRTINSLYFNIGGWDPPERPKASTKLYFGDVTVLNSDGSVHARVDYTKSFTASKASMSFATESPGGEESTLKCSLLSVDTEGRTNVESKRFDLSSNKIATDWSAAKKVVVPIYSKVANSDYLNLVFCLSATNLRDGYVQKKIELNWTGWKNVEIPIDSNAKWKTINAVYFNIGGWASPVTPMVSTKLYFGDLKVVNSDGSIHATIPFTSESIASLSEMKYETISADSSMDQKVVSDIGTFVLSDSDTSLGNITWLNLDDHIGYYFPGDGSENPGQVKMRYKDNNFRYFEAIFDHGQNPENSSYAYALLPNMDAYETAAYAANSPVEILSNTGSVQAVRHNILGITSIVFWEAGTFEGITVDKPMIVMLKEGDTETVVAVSDPTQKLESAEIKFDRIMLLKESDERITKGQFGSISSINVDFTNALGKTLQATLKHSEPVALDLVLTDSEGNEYNRYLAHKENLVKASISSTNLSSSSENIRFVIAMYSKSGELQDVHTTTATILKGRTRVMDAVTLTPDEDTAMIKGYVWEKNSIKPFESISLN